MFIDNISQCLTILVDIVNQVLHLHMLKPWLRHLDLIVNNTLKQ